MVKVKYFQDILLVTCEAKTNKSSDLCSRRGLVMGLVIILSCQLLTLCPEEVCAGARGMVDLEILKYMFQKSLKMEST